MSAIGPLADIAKRLLALNTTSNRIDIRMRRFFFCSLFSTGLFLLIDVVAFEGRNSAEAWKEAEPIIQIVSGTLDGQIERIWR